MINRVMSGNMDLPAKYLPLLPISEAVIQRIFEASGEIEGALALSDLGPVQASIIRSALVAAEQQRDEQIEPGEAYLRGFATAYALFARERLTHELSDSLNASAGSNDL